MPKKQFCQVSQANGSASSHFRTGMNQTQRAVAEKYLSPDVHVLKMQPILDVITRQL